MCIFAAIYIVPEWSDLESFKKQTKTVDSKHDIRFKNLFKAIGRNNHHAPQRPELPEGASLSEQD